MKTLRGARVGVVGGGIVGLAVAREVQRRATAESVTVLEAESAIGRHQTSHNSGVVHAGVYYPEGSLKAQLCSRGRDLLREFCSTHDLAYDECGKLIVAVDEREVDALALLEDRARANRVPGLRRVDRAGIREIEPAADGVAALHSPATAAVDFGAVADALGADLVAAGGTVACGWEVRTIQRRGAAVRVTRRDDGEAAEFDRLILCGGLQSDRLARRAGDTRMPLVVPFRGEYLRLRPDRTSLVRGMIYPVPDPSLPFLGVHFTRRVDGSVDVGPNAVLSLSRRGYGRNAIDLRDLATTVGSAAFWRLGVKSWRFGLGELAGSLSTRRYVRSARRYVPELTVEDVIPGPVGIRAQALGRGGALIDDFVISNLGPIVAVRNAPSPAATSAMAIAEHVCDQLEAA